jgi:hypothetical protein
MRLEADDQLRRLISYAAGDVTQAHALLAWLFEDRLQEGVADLIKQSADEKKALSAEQQRQRRADLAAELLLIERRDIAAFEYGEAQEAMIDISRRYRSARGAAFALRTRRCGCGPIMSRSSPETNVVQLKAA